MANYKLKYSGEEIDELLGRIDRKVQYYPDYANIDVLGGVGTFTISRNGYFQLRASTNGAAEAAIFHRITVNGRTVDEGYTASRNYTYYSSPLIPVMEGDVVNVTGGTANVTYKSYLYKIRISVQNPRG